MAEQCLGGVTEEGARAGGELTALRIPPVRSRSRELLSIPRAERAAELHGRFWRGLSGEKALVIFILVGFNSGFEEIKQPVQNYNDVIWAPTIKLMRLFQVLTSCFQP